MVSFNAICTKSILLSDTSHLAHELDNIAPRQDIGIPIIHEAPVVWATEAPDKTYSPEEDLQEE